MGWGGRSKPKAICAFKLTAKLIKTTASQTRLLPEQNLQMVEPQAGVEDTEGHQSRQRSKRSAGVLERLQVGRSSNVFQPDGPSESISHQTLDLGLTFWTTAEQQIHKTHQTSQSLVCPVFAAALRNRCQSVQHLAGGV